MKHLYTILLCSLLTIGMQAQTVFINEIHYENLGSDQGEAVEIAGPAGTNLNGWTLAMYNGSNGLVYLTITLANTIPDQDNGYGTLSFPVIGMQNGAPDGMALVDAGNNVIQFLSYEGTFMATAGPASGMTSVDIGVAETSNTAAGRSLQLKGSGVVYSDFFWEQPDSDTVNQPNNFQFFNRSIPSNDSCASALVVDCGDVISGTTVAATDNFTATASCGFPIVEGEVWYQYSATTPGFLVAQLSNASFSPRVTIFEGPCGNFTCLNGNNFLAQAPIEPNKDYYIVVHGAPGQAGTFDLTVSCEPLAVCVPAPTFSLDANGSFVLQPSDLDGGSGSPFGIQGMSVSPDTFDCNDIGNTNLFVVLTVTDNQGQSAQCATIINIVDDMDPTANVVSSFDAFLDANGQVSITMADIDNGSTDNCGIASTSLDVTSFTCSDLGPNNVVLTVVDDSGNTTNETTVVNVIDNLPPVLVLQDVTIDLDSNGEAFLGTGQVNIGSSDNCVSFTTVLSQDFFTCADIGPNEVVFTGTDNSGNSSMATVVVTVIDIDDPIAVTNNIQVSLDANGSATIVPGDIDAGSNDNCSIANLSLDIDTFDCSNIGSNTVQLTVTDPSGNSATETATVDVVDDTAPAVMGQDISVDLAGNASVSIVPADLDNGSTDNCDLTLSIDVDTFTTEGVFPVVLTGTDSSGNSSSDTVEVTVFDSTLGVLDRDAAAAFVLYPNPTSGELQFRTELIISEIRVFSIGGKLMKGIQQRENAVDVSHLASGMYFIQLETSEGKVTKQFIRQ